MSLDPAAITALFDDHRATLWGMGYRMLGSAPDADEVLQETFVRLLEGPPEETDAPMLPWLVRVAMTLARDELRRRKSRRYEGPWLPTPVPAERLRLEWDAPEARYELSESAGFAFLLALEALSETQRAVLVLRDVFDLSTRETAEALELTEANVEPTLHRARQAMEGYEAARVLPTPEEAARTGEVLQRFTAALSRGDRDAVLALLADDVTALSDGGDQFVAAKVPVVGAEEVASSFLELADGRGAWARFDVQTFNGLPALVFEGEPPRPDCAPRGVVRLELNAAGKVQAIHSVLTSEKLMDVGHLDEEG